MTLRIVTGNLSGRRFDAPQSEATRPTMDKTREAIFNMLRHREPLLENAIVLDVFAGSGAYGIEAVSNGAAICIFFENDPKAEETLHQNILKFDLGMRCRVLSSDATRLRENAGAVATHAFFDPPYGLGLLKPAMKTFFKNGWMNESTLCIVEREKGKEDVDPLPGAFVVEVEKTYGRAHITLGRMKNAEDDTKPSKKIKRKVKSKTLI